MSAIEEVTVTMPKVDALIAWRAYQKVKAFYAESSPDTEQYRAACMQIAHRLGPYLDELEKGLK